VRRFVVTAVAGMLVLSGCGSGSDDEGDATGSAGSSPPAAAGPVRVVTATDVYADIVRSIGGDAVDVQALVSSDSGADPHSYEATARDQLAVKDAQLVIANGGHYDEFLTKALDAAGGERTVLTAVTEAADHEGEAAAASSPAPHDHGEDSNEHVWYDLKAMTVLATGIAGALSALRPSDSAAFTSRAGAFQNELSDLMDRQDHIRKHHGGTAVAVTEPLPLFLLADCGLVDKTPAEFSEAIEEGTDVPARVLQETLDPFFNHTVELLAYNSQTTGPQTERVQDAAAKAGIPVVPMSETLPAGLDYLSWMRANLDALEKALDGEES
jgi:zinc/manganese transport system substrate-binding protein